MRSQRHANSLAWIAILGYVMLCGLLWMVR